MITIIKVGNILGSLLLSAFMENNYPQADANPLEAFKWQKRILVVFMPTTDHPVGTAQLNLLKQASPEVTARDIQVLVVVADQITSNRLKPSDGVALRRRFKIASSAYTMVLIGKDGGEKYRTNKAEKPAQVFKIIDAMPMRQNEVNEQNRSKNN